MILFFRGFMRADESNEEAMFIFLDMEKAFDRCSWEFLTEGLKALDFGDKFIQFVKLAYSHDHPPSRRPSHLWVSCRTEWAPPLACQNSPLPS